MAQRIKFRRSSVAGRVPTTSSLSLGELAFNTADGKVFFQRGDDTIQSIFTTNALITGSLLLSGSASITGSLNVSETGSISYITGDKIFINNQEDGHLIGRLYVDYYGNGNPALRSFNGDYIRFMDSIVLHNNSAKITAGSSHVGDLQFTHDRSGDYGYIFNTTDSGSVFRIDGSGRVGIGTTSPAYTLDVNGDGRFTDSLTVTGSLNVSGSINHDGDLTVTGVVTAQEFRTEFVSASIIYQSGSTKFGDTSDDRHSFTGSLEVTSGDTSVSKISINGERNSYLKIQDSGSRYSLLQRRSDLTEGQLRILQNGSTKFIFTDGGYLGINTASVPNRALEVEGEIRSTSGSYFATTDGNVGIGTTVPTRKLHVEGSSYLKLANNSFLDFTTPLNTQWWITDNDAKFTMYLQASRTGTYRLRTGDNAKSTYFIQNRSGSLFARGGASYPDIAPGSALLELRSTTEGLLIPRTDVTSNISTPAQGLLTYLTSSADEGVYYYNSGSYQGWTRVLNNSGSQVISGSLVVSESIATPSLAIEDYITHIGDPNSYFGFANNDSFVIYTAGNRMITSGDNAVVINELQADKNFVVRTSNSNSTLFVDGGTDRVGIGTTTPSEDLQVISSVMIGERGFTSPIDGKLRVASTTSYGEIGFSSKYDNFPAGIRSYAVDALYERDLRFYTKDTVSSGDGLERMIITGGGNIGIGTTTPSWKLHVNSTQRAGIFGFGTPWTSDGVLYIGAYYATHTPLLVEHHSTLANSNSYFFAKFRNGDDEDVIKFRTNGSADFNGSLTVNSTNNLGRITVNPTSDSGDAIGIDERGFIAFADGGVLTTRFRGLPGGGFQFQDDAYNTFFNLSKGSNSYLNTTGNFGIGTTTPTEKLTVAGNISGSGNLYLPNNAEIRGGGALNIYPSTTSGNGRIQIGQFDITFYSALRTRAVQPEVDLSYDLGTSSRRWSNIYGAGLDISGSTSFDGDLVVTGSLTVSGSSTFTNIGPAVFSGSATFNEGVISSRVASLENTNNYISLAGGGGSFIDFRANNSSIARMSSTGMFIGGDTSPSARLHIVGTGNSAATTNFLLENSDGFDIIKVTDHGSVEFRYTGDADGGMIRGGIFYGERSGGFQNYLDLTGNNNSLNVDSGDFTITTGDDIILSPAGNVGIGTTSPDRALHIASSTTTGSYLRFSTEDSNTGRDDINGGIEFETRDGSNSGVNASIVGVQDLAGEGAIALSAGKAGSLTQMLTVKESAVIIGSDSSLTNIQNKPFTSGANTTGERLSILQDPAKLYAINIVSEDNSATTTGIGFNPDGTRAPMSLIAVENAGLRGEGHMHFVVKTGDATYDPATLDDSKMVIKNSGLIGIGTQSPAYKLDVSGSGNFTDGLTVTGSINHDGDLTVTGTVTAQEFKTEFVSASIIYRSGSTKFGDTLDDQHSFTGSLELTGSLGIHTGTNQARLHVYNSADGGSVRTSVFEHRWGVNVLSQYARYGIMVKSEDLGTSLGITNQTYNSILQGTTYASPFTAKGIALNPLGGVVLVGRNAQSQDTANFIVSGSSKFEENIVVSGSGGNTFETYHEAGANGSGIKLSRTTDGYQGRIYFNSVYQFPDNGGNFKFGSTNSAQFYGTSAAITQRNTSPTFTWMAGDNSGKGFYLQAPAANDSFQLYLHDNYNQQNVRKVMSFSNESDFTLHKSGSSDSLLFVSQSGNVGIGTDAPAYALHINRPDPYIQIQDTSAATRAEMRAGIIMKDSTGAQSFQLTQTNSVDVVMRANAGDLSFGTFAGTVMRLDGNNVGIGTSTPSEILTVQGNISGSGNLYIDGSITGSALQIAGINYPTTDGTINQSIITDGAGNLSFGAPAAANTIIYVKNVSGGTIEKGTPLYVTGSGTSGNIVGVWPADAGDITRMPAMAIAGEQLLDGAEGEALLDGFIGGVNTSAFASGDEVFVAVGGGYTNVAPTGSGVYIQKLGNVEKVHASNGSGVINGPNTFRALPNWETGKVMVGTDIYPVTSSVIHLDETNGRLGIGTSTPTEVFEVKGIAKFGNHASNNLTIDGSTTGYNLAEIETRFNGLSLITNAGAGAPHIRLLPGTGGNVGVNISSPAYRLDVNGTGNFRDSLTVTGSLTVSGSSTFTNIGPAVLSGSLGVAGNVTLSTGGYIYGDTTDPYIRLNDAAGAYLGYGTSYIGVGGPTTIVDQGTTVIRFRSNRIVATKNTLIGTSTIDETPSARLQVRGSGIAGNTIALQVENSNASASLLVRDDNSVDFYNEGLRKARIFHSGSDAVMQINNGPNYGLLMKGTGNTPYIGAISTGTLRFAPMNFNGDITGNTLMSLGFGNSLVTISGDLSAKAIRTQFSSSFEVGYFNGGDNGIVWKNSGYGKFSAGIKAVDTQNYSRMGLAFYTGDDADTTTDAVERMRITRTGNIGFGTTTFNNSVGFAVYKSYSAFENGTDHLTLRPGTGLYYSSDLKFVNQSYANRGSTSGDALRMTLTADGAVSASRFYTSINDTSGNIRASYDSLFINNENETSFRSRMQAFNTSPIRNNYHFQATSGSTDTNVFYVKDTGKTYIKEDLTVENGVTITGSLNVLGDITHDGDLTVTGTVTAQEFKTEFVSASIIYRSGSTKFGDTFDDKHEFTGSIKVLSGSLDITDTSNQLVLRDSADPANDYVTFEVTSTGELIITPAAENVGINTNPDYAFHVYESTQNNVVKVESGGTQAQILFENSNSTDVVAIGANEDQLQLRTDAGPIEFFASNTGSPIQRMTIRETGNIGIGTASPLRTLHLSGSYLQDVAVADGSIFQISSSAAGALQPIFDIRTVANGRTEYDFNVWKSSTSKFQILADNTITLQQIGGSGGVNLKGNLKTSLSTNYGGELTLHRYGALSLNDDDAYDHIPSASLYVNRGLYNTSTDYLFLLANQGADKMAVDLDGNVGIGTISPNQKLQVQGGDVTIRLDQYGDTQSYGFGNPARQNDAAFIKYDGVGNFTGDLHLGVVTSSANVPASEILTIYRSGDVGIGTTTPTAKFEVVGTTRISGVTTIGNQVNFGFGTNGGNLTFDATSLALTANSGRGISLRPTNQTSGSGIDITSAGNVGIGTATPDSVLELYSDSATDFLKLTSGGGLATPVKLIFEKTTAEQGIIEYNRNGDLEIYNTDNDGGVMINGRNSEAGDLYVADGGNVGIGTTTPGQKLHVAGTVRIVGTNSFDLYSDGTGMRFDLNSGIRGFQFENNSGSLFALDGTGAARLNQYGSGTHTGTAAYTLGVDSSGNIIEIAQGNTGENTDVDTGTGVIDTFPSSSASSTFTNYVVQDGTNFRAGQLMSVWDSSGNIQYSDVTTNDIGDTSGVSLFVEINGADIEVKATVPSDNWSVKTNTTLL